MQCYTAFYCSRRCQKMDWSIHQRFCLKSQSQELEIERRDLCLQLIRTSENMIFRFFMNQRYGRRPGFLLIRGKNEPLYLPIYPLPQLHRLEIPIDEERYAELEYEGARALDTAHPAIVLLHIAGMTSKVYVVSSKKMMELYSSINKMPDALVGHIFDMVLQEEYLRSSPEDALLLRSMIRHRDHTGKAAVEEGGFLDCMHQRVGLDRLESK